MSVAITTLAPRPLTREDAVLRWSVIERRDRNARLRLLSRIHRRYATTTAAVQLGPVQLSFTRIANPDVVLDEVAAEEDRRERLAGKTPGQRREPQHLPYWAEVWDSAVGLGTHLAVVGGDLWGRSVLDLGCGQGLSGCSAAALGASVMFADLEAPSLLFARLNAMNALTPSPGTPGEGWGEGDFERTTASDVRNHPHPNPLPDYQERGPRQCIRTRRLNWQTDDLAERFDVILGADILYDRQQWPHLQQFWRGHLRAGGRVLLAEPGRPSGEQFIAWISARGWRLEAFAQPVPTRPGPIRLIQLLLDPTIAQGA